MDVNRPQRRNIEDFLRKNLPERRRDAQIGVEIQQILIPIPADAFWLKDRDALRCGVLLHGGHGELLAAPLGAVGLRDHADDRISALHQGFEGWHGELRRAHKHDSH